MQERRRLVGHAELRFQFLAPLGVLEQLLLRFERGQLVVEHKVDQLRLPRLDPRQLTLGRDDASPLLHPKPVHLLGELVAELLEEVLAHQLVLQRAEHPVLDLLTRNRECVRARAAPAGAKAAEMLTRVDDEARAALAALGQAREEVLRPAELVELAALRPLRPLVLYGCVSRVHGLPQLVVDDAQFGNVFGDPVSLRILTRHALAGFWIADVPKPVPDHPTDVELVVQDAGAAPHVAVNGARTPERALRPADLLCVQCLHDLLRRRAGQVVREDPSDDRGLLGNNLAFTGRDFAILEAADDAVAVADAAAGFTQFDASAQATPRLVGQLLQVERVHRALEADVQVRDVAFGERDDADVGERQALEEPGGVFLIAAEAVERFSEDRIHALALRQRHQLLETGAHYVRARRRMVGEFAGDRPALALHELAAHSKLIADGGVALILGGVAGVDSDSHSKPSSRVRPASVRVRL